MRTTRIELDGDAGHVAIERKVGETSIRIDSIIRDLIEVAITITRDRKRKDVQARAHLAAEDRVVDALVGANASASTKDAFRKKVRAGEMDPFAIAAMDEIGIDLTRHQPTAIDSLEDTSFDLIVTLAPEAAHARLRTQAPSILSGRKSLSLPSFISQRRTACNWIQTVASPATPAA